MTFRSDNIEKTIATAKIFHTTKDTKSTKKTRQPLCLFFVAFVVTLGCGQSCAAYAALDNFFFVFHSMFIIFNLFGWMWKKTRRVNLMALFLTACSWFGLGLCYGLGYCPCTDWHWQVRMKLGDFAMPNSYVKFLIDSITGLNTNPVWVDRLTLIFFLLALAASLYVNRKIFLPKKKRIGS